MEGTTIIVALIGALAGGGLSRLFTVRESKKEKQLENKEKEEDVQLKNADRWEKLADQLQDQIENLNERIDKKDARITELEDVNASLRHKLDETNSALIKATLLKCTKLACIDRQPPLGFTELTPEEMVRERKKLAVEYNEE